MAAFAPPVRRGDFLYSSVLYADAGNGNHHPRASTAELVTLLRPETRSRDVKPTKEAKDPVGHWYTAQLVHYGLPPTKDKNAAKVRLLNALNSHKLEILPWILKLESDLKNEWEADNRKAKRGAGAKRSVPAKRSPGKAAQSQFSQTTNVTVNLSLPPGFSMIEQPGVHHTNKNNDGTPPKKQSAKRKQDDDDNAMLQTPIKKSRVKKELSIAPTASSPYSSTPRIKQEASSKTLTPPRIGSGSVKQEKQVTIKRERAPVTPRPPPTIQLSGTYKITCPAALSTFPSLAPSTLRLDLCRDASRDVWWVTFTFAAWHCVILMDPGPSFETLGEPCTLGWRLRDLENGELKFGKRCTGEMTCFRDETIRGSLFNVPGAGMIEFWGPRMKTKGVLRSADGLKAEWDDFVDEAYGR
ncbi:hypothetical protein K491DRAFT_680303 [Lophiostoma macrostomum CBS 122681]|uniref:Uncharacterized protein n=1 Tax=Lophiostoma macrostomum CBS 122681 TaxID=1314788 RepID=A0A6A6T4K6_9PLEO|nr:hypothetical protein K491DRAFT_680303 [Lophiostoma macrostomum CBS 122681]